MPLVIMISAGLALIAVGLALMYGINANSGWTALLAGFVAGGIGVGIANPALAAGALRVVDRARTGMASGISNTFRLAGVAVGSRRSAPYSRTALNTSFRRRPATMQTPSAPR